ncbi:MAG: hypothetical protein ACOX55_04980 [Christensenellales bacterium]|jgi:hypothetical protein
MSEKELKRKKAAIATIRFKYRYNLISASGEETFAGILVKHFFPNDQNGQKGISDPWAATTTANCCSDYRIRLIDVLPKLKPISEITVDELEEAIEILVQRYNYKPITENHYRLLIRVVFEAAHRAGHDVESNVWGSVFHDAINIHTILEKEFLSIPKSLTAFEAVSFFSALTSDIRTAPGEDLGLLMMLFTGCRNEEIVPINFNHFFDIAGSENAKFFAVYESGTKKRNIIKSGGKTRNTFRFIPVPTVLWSLLEERREMLENYLISSKTAKKAKQNACVDELPVACFGNDYNTMCVVDDLSRRARRLLREVKYESKQLATVEAIMISERRLDNEIEEKEPTAYLLRRFYATTLYILGFSDAEQEYLMGHGISDDGVDRRDYTNEDLRIELWQKMEQHPLCEMVRRYGIEVFHEPTKCAQIQQDLQAMQSLFQKIRNPNKRRINLLYQDYMMALLELHNNKKRRVRTKYK